MVNPFPHRLTGAQNRMSKVFASPHFVHVIDGVTSDVDVGKPTCIVPPFDGLIRDWTETDDFEGLASVDDYQWAAATNDGEYLAYFRRDYVLGSDVITLLTAPINEDGSPGTWTEQTDPPPTHFPYYGSSYGTRFCCHNGFMYIVENAYHGASNKLYCAPFADGVVGSWVEALDCGNWWGWSLTFSGSKAYITGGWSGAYSPHPTLNPPLTTVTSYDVSPTTGVFTTPGTSETVLPSGRLLHFAKVVGSELWVMGGRRANGGIWDYNPVVLYAPIGGGGAIGSWSSAASGIRNLLEEGFAHSLFNVQGYLFDRTYRTVVSTDLITWHSQKILTAGTVDTDRYEENDLTDQEYGILGAATMTDTHAYVLGYQFYSDDVDVYRNYYGELY